MSRAVTEGAREQGLLLQLFIQLKIAIVIETKQQNIASNAIFCCLSVYFEV